MPTETEQQPTEKNEFETLVDQHESDDVESTEEGVPAESTEQVEEPGEETPPSESPPADTPQETPPASEKPVEAPPQAAKPVETPQEAPKEKTEEELRVEREKWRADRLVELNEQYKGLITEEQMKEWETDPRAVLAQIMSNAHMSVYESLMQGFQGILPEAVNQQLAQQNAVRDYRDKFFSKWPKLRGVEEEKLHKIMQAYRSTKPGQDVDKEIDELGKIASMVLNIAPDEAPPAKAKPKSKPFKPAAPGGAAPPPAPSTDDNPFTEMVNNLIESGDYSAG